MKTSISFLKSRLSTEDTIAEITKTDADFIHVDVMDGKFVERKVLEIPEVIKLLSKSEKVLDIHLMVEHPLEYISAFKNLNARYITIHIEIEEAAAIDGCNPLQMFFKVVMPICKPIYISVAILEIMWIWNDYLLPYLTLDRTLYRTIPIHIQYLQGSYGSVDLGATMAIIMMTLIPIIIIYILFQKHIIKGVVEGAVK